MKNLFKHLGALLTQPSTYKGLAVLAGVAATGAPQDLLNVVVSNTGEVQATGALATVGALAVGAWETVRNERKAR